MSTYRKENLKRKLCCVDCTRTKTQCISLHAFDQGFPNRGGGNPPQWGGWEILIGGSNLYDGGNPRRNDSDHSNLFQGQKQHPVNIEH